MKRFSTFALLFAFGLGATAAQATNLLAPALDDDSPIPSLAPSPQVPAGSYNPTQSLAPLVEALSPAVVNIYVEQKVILDSAGFFLSPQFFCARHKPDMMRY